LPPPDPSDAFQLRRLLRIYSVLFVSPFLLYYMTRLSLPKLRHLQTLCTHAFGLLPNLRDLKLRAPESQEADQLAWSILHCGYLKNLVQVIFQYFRTLNSLAGLQESTCLHLVESDLATHLLGLINDYKQANPLDSDQDATRSTRCCCHSRSPILIACNRTITTLTF
jgi:hypothetical protein